MSRVKHNHPLTAEFDERCGWCAHDMQHTPHEHEKAIRERVAEESARENSLLRAAKNQYDQP